MAVTTADSANANNLNAAIQEIRSMLSGGNEGATAILDAIAAKLVSGLGKIRLAPTAFASLPSPAAEGMLASVTNSNTAVWGAVIAGGGANHVLAYFNGSSWTVAAK